MKAAIKSQIDPTSWVDLYGDYLFQFVRLRVQNTQIAEDLVQETFLSALKSLDSFRGESRVRTWLTGILKRKIIDHYRKNRISISIDSGGGMEPLQEFEPGGERKGQWKPEHGPHDWGRSPAQLYEDRQFMQTLEACLKNLPERLSGVFILREIDGLDSGEICNLFDISPSNLWVILHRARHQLRNCLEINWLESGTKNEK